MTENVFESIDTLKKVFAESQNARLFTVIPENFGAEVVNVAKSDCNKMIEVLNQFYKEDYQKSEGIDDFVTLFGAYCNYYILYGLHLILKENDLSTSKIFELKFVALKGRYVMQDIEHCDILWVDDFDKSEKVDNPRKYLKDYFPAEFSFRVRIEKNFFNALVHLENNFTNYSCVVLDVNFIFLKLLFRGINRSFTNAVTRITRITQR